jgi:L-2-hydroxycarboxylate dehydrogenase (NAD+)
MPQVSIASIKRFTQAVLQSCDVSAEDVMIITDSILFAHNRGKGTHGITRLPIYVRKIKNGLMSPQTRLSAVRESPVVTVLDADHGFGQVAAYKGMELCVEKAEKYGIGVVGIRNSNNFGTAGFIAELATKSKMIGVVLANSAPAIAPTGGNKPVFGTNPIGLAFPRADDQFPISLDMATSFAARGKIRLAAKNNEKIPFGWALDENGNPTDNPLEALKGSMIPIGEHKGYGLSLAVDILAGLLTGAAFGGDVRPLNQLEGYSNYGHLVVAINVKFFTDYDEFTSRMNQLEQKVKSAGKEGSVFLPGEKSWQYLQNNKKSISIGDKPIKELQKLADELGLPEKLNISN